MDITANALLVTQGLMVIVFVHAFALTFSVGAGMLVRYFWDLFPKPSRKNAQSDA